MKLKAAFIRLLFLQCLPVTIVALILGILYLVLAPGPLNGRNSWINLLILVHCIALVMRLGRMGGRSMEFLYTQGYSRDQIWNHLMAGTAVSVLAVWLPMALCLWLPIRSGVQGHAFINPYYPLMYGREMTLPWLWLYEYGLLLPLFHYVWIRHAQPMRDNSESLGAVAIAIQTVGIAGYVLMSFLWHPLWFKVVVVLLSALMILTILIVGRLLHRSMEVRV